MQSQSIYMLVAFREGQSDRHLVLDTGRFLIGRDPQSDLVLPDVSVSRKHACLVCENGSLVITDKDSRNGLFVNGERVSSAKIGAGDFLSIGAYALVLRAYRESSSADLQAPKGKTLFVGEDASRRLHEETFYKRIPKNIMALYRAVLLFGEPLQEREALRRVLELTLESLSAQRGIVVTYANDGEQHEAAVNVCTAAVRPLDGLDPRLLNYVRSTRQALITEHAPSDPRFPMEETEEDPSAGPAMCVPLCGSRDCVGALYLDASPETPPFDEEDIEFVSTLGHLLAVIIENRLLSNRMVQQERMAAMGEALAGVAHDICNLLVGAKAGLDLLDLAVESGERNQITRSLSTVRSSVEHVEAYLNELLLFSRETRVERAPTDVHTLVGDAISALKALAEEKGVELTFGGGGFEKAVVDRYQIHRVLANLIRNAVDACTREEKRVHVSVGRKAGTLMLQVADTGTGIEQTDLPRLYEPFFTTKRRGTGLGLPVCRHIVEKHGGRIEAHSEPGKGSVFAVSLPDSFPERPAQEAQTPDTAAVDTVFKRCPTCGTVWQSQDDLLSDPRVRLAGYQVHFDELGLGLFYFDHACGTTLVTTVGDFRHLYDGPAYTTRKTGTEECPEYCLNKRELRPCPAECDCAQVRETLQLIHHWPKRGTQ